MHNETVQYVAERNAAGHVALAHDYVTQRGGAERVALSMTRALPGAPLHTAFYDPASTFPEFSAVDVRPLPIDRVRPLRHHHRLALPLLAGAMSRHHVTADVLVASSSGWAHGMNTCGRKIVYCHAPARWLHQTERYAHGDGTVSGMRPRAVTLAIDILGPALREWDLRAAQTADRYLVNSTTVRDAVREAYGIEAEVLAPPSGLVGQRGGSRAPEGIEGPFVLCVARLLPYKNVDLVIEAVARIPGLQLVVVGSGPEAKRLQALADETGAARILSHISDEELRWLYENCEGLVAASFEDFGLSPVEAAAHGKPTAALHAGGYLDTVVEERTGVFFHTLQVDDIAGALEDLVRGDWSEEDILAHSQLFSEERFGARLREIVAEELALA